MKFKIGDKVKFLNEVGEGEVTALIDEKLVKVKIEDGFEIPMMANELVIARTFNNYDREIENSEEEIIPVDIPKLRKKKEPEIRLKENIAEKALKNIIIAFVPESSASAMNADIAAYLVNDCDYSLYYFIGYRENVSWYYLKHGFLEDNTKILIRTFSQSDISKVKKLKIQLLFLSKGKYYPQEPVDKIVDIENIRFYKESTFKENDFFRENGLTISVTEESIESKLKDITREEIEKVVEKKDKVENKKSISPVNPDIHEVDLHIHEIVDDYSNLSSGEIINIQMSRFQIALEGAILSKAKKIVFIHGLGNGKLKYEIIKTLREKYPDLVFQDASFKEYGYGATLVFLK